MDSKNYQGLLLIEDRDQSLPEGSNFVVHEMVGDEFDLSSLMRKAILAYSRALPVPYLFFYETLNKANLLQVELRHYENQIKLANAPGMHLLSAILNDALQYLLEHQVVATDEFQLEANLRQFSIETHSLFLKKRLEELDISYQEKWQELNRLLAVKFISLEEIKQGIERIINEHQEFQKTYEKVALYYQVLLTHLVGREKSLYYYFLFEMQMGLKPVLIGSLEDENIRSAIALWMTLQKKSSKENLQADFFNHYKTLFGHNPQSFEFF